MFVSRQFYVFHKIGFRSMSCDCHYRNYRYSSQIHISSEASSCGVCIRRRRRARYRFSQLCSFLPDIQKNHRHEPNRISKKRVTVHSSQTSVITELCYPVMAGSRKTSEHYPKSQSNRQNMNSTKTRLLTSVPLSVRRIRSPFRRISPSFSSFFSWRP